MNLNELKCLFGLRPHDWTVERFGPYQYPVRECQGCGRTEVKPDGCPFWFHVSGESIFHFRHQWLMQYLRQILYNDEKFGFDEYFRALYLMKPEYTDEETLKRYRIEWK